MDKIYSNSEIMKGVLEGLISDADKKKMEESSSFISIWRSILYSIKSVVNPNSGSNMFFHSRVIDIKDTTLVLEVDHSGFIQLFETHKKYILRGLEMKVPQLNIKNISYKLDKKNDYNTQRNLTREEMAKCIMDESKKEDTLIQFSGENKEYPAELEVIFSRMKKSILTNNK
ncbi:MAG: hypothetical protein J6K76_00170 [Spirochaetaceae bacterium]|nr:hypothetical protein [Spirochaetaceae bacterium]